MNVRLYTFSKRKNSTAVPTGGSTIICQLKAPTDILSPALEFAGQTEAPTSYNYCYLPDFSRYYFISKWEWDLGIWIAHCNVDVLASWKSYIKNTTAYILYSNTLYTLTALDTRIAAVGSQNRNVSVEPFVGAIGAGTSTGPTGTFCLTVLDNTGIWATGATTTYFMTYQQMQIFAQELINPTTWEELKQFWENPMDAIVDCYYLPVDVNQYIALTTNRNLVIGDYTFPSAQGKSAQATNLALKPQHATIEIPWQYSDFRNLPPYSMVELFVPYCGSKPLPSENLYGMKSFFVDYGIDVTTGLIQCIAYVQETVLQEWTGNIQVKLPIGQSQSRVEQILGAVSGAASTAAGIIAGNGVATVKGLATTIGSVVSQTDQKMLGGFSGSVLGSILGNNTGRWQEFRCSVTYHRTNTEPENIRPIIGNVYGKCNKLDSLSGYCMTSEVSVQAPATDTELDMINSALDNGVFLN